MLYTNRINSPLSASGLFAFNDALKHSFRANASLLMLIPVAEINLSTVTFVL